MNKILPPPVTTGSSYADSKLKRPPVDLPTALEYFENSEFMIRTLGSEVHSHFVEFYQNEVNKHEENITKWELKRYMDLI